MRTAETKTGSPILHKKKGNEAFFDKGNNSGFFSKNAAVSTPFFSLSTIQAKLTIGQPGDKYEQEADAMADQVVQKMSNRSVQRKCAECAAEEKESELAPKLQPKAIFESNEEQPIQKKCAACQERSMHPKPIQMQGGPSTASPDLENRLSATSGGGSPLPKDTRSSMESAFGADFSNVRVHTGQSAVQMNQELGAQAFTHGSDVYFNSGKYDTNSSGGQRLLAHELTHVVQQGAGVSMLQQKCDVAKAKRYYRKTRSGRKVQWTSGLVEELYKVVGVPYKYLRDAALTSGEIDQDFVDLVCKAQEILGFRGSGVDGKIGPKTLAAWEKWKTGGKHGIDYNKLFKDKKLEIGVAVGQDFHNPEFKDIETLLIGKGLALTVDTPTKRTYSGKRKYMVQGDRTAPSVEIEVIVDCISAQSTSPKQTFSEFLTQKEITIYSGHARYGTGPDFDPEKSPDENFIIGVNSALHKAGRLKKGYSRKMNKILKGRANDLEELSKTGKFDPNLYQVWFFNACSSINYLDEIRGGLVRDKSGKKKAVENLRVMGTKRSIYSDAVPILKGLLEMQTMEEIIRVMNEKEKEEVKKRGERPKSGYYFSN